jgi:hypothetical protein
MTQTLLILLFALAVSSASPAPQSPAKADDKTRPHEVSLARLRPGKDTISAANRLYDPALRHSLPGSSGQPEWYDACTGHFLRVEITEKGAIESVTVSALGPRRDDCPANAPDFLHRRLWKSGRGLALGDPRKRVLQLYGQPDSSGPSTQHGRELQLLFYSYEELGTHVPQVMEITLERDRVVQITLAFPGL